MATTRVMMFTDTEKAKTVALNFKASGYKVIRIDKIDTMELKNTDDSSEYWYSANLGPNVDYILVIATQESIKIM